MSSTFTNDKFIGHDFSGSACTDGVWGSSSIAWTFCHSATGLSDQWLSVQVPIDTLVSSVNIHGRSDGYAIS
eukprot:7285381-Prymnesium_polylepis.2